MSSFIGDNLLISNNKGLELYEKYARDLPIYDYHCHLSPEEIANDKVFYDIGELMLKGDHYKWRIMRATGIPEQFITGNASYKDKFKAYAKALSFAIGNPLYTWTHMELKRFFNITEPLTEKSADSIYEEANRKMADGSYSARNLIAQSNVYLIATTDDPADNLEYHEKISKIEGFETKVVPTFRPDFLCNPNKAGYKEYVEKLGATEGTEISTFDDLIWVLNKRMNYFSERNCRIADHGISYVPDCECTPEEAKCIFQKALSESGLSKEEEDKFLVYMLELFACEYSRRGWVMQIHMSPLRNQNTSLFKKVGPDSGIDSVGDVVSASALGTLFDRVESECLMPKTILYTLNPSAYYVLSTMAGNFSCGSPGKIQLGAAWWFCDHKDGIEEQLRIFANTGVLGYFNGMLTDSRSFTSYVRHDYFRRIFCSLVGQWVENGEYPDDDEMLKGIVEGVCFENAKKYFGE